MEKTIFLGQGSQILTTSSAQWEHSLAAVPQHSLSRLSFMTDIHQRIRYYVVRELARGQGPLMLEQISKALDIPSREVENILRELEQKLFFLVRNGSGEVVWAYPFTVERTAHSLEFNTGERSFAA